MKALLALSVLFVATAFGQSNDCDSLEKCQEVLRAHPKSSLARFRIGEIYFRQGNFQHAAVEGFMEATRGDAEPKWTQVLSHLNLGRIYDITNQRPRAINEYRIVVKMNDNSGGAVDAATQHIETPYRRQ